MPTQTQGPPAAFPFVTVDINTSDLLPTAQRAPGVVAVVGKSDDGSAPENTPKEVDTTTTAAGLFGEGTELYKSLAIVLTQSPRPSKIYGVKVGTDYAEGLAALEAADDVTFVCLANEADVGTASATGTAATDLTALFEHCRDMSDNGNKRIGVAMLDPGTDKTTSTEDAIGEVAALKSDKSRMIMIAARGATGDAAAAAMGAIAGYAPQSSAVLKQVRGFTIPVEKQYSPIEIKDLSEANIIPVIDPALIVGDSLHLAEGRCFTSDATLLYIDVVRVLDDIEFRLKAGLIGLVGLARITKPGMSRLETAISGILGTLVRSEVIEDYTITIPVLEILRTPESTWGDTDKKAVRTARENRLVEIFLSVTYGPAVHSIKVTLTPHF